MKILTFNTATGLYDFALDEVETDWHTHPAMEIVLAPRGDLQLEVDHQLHTSVFFAIINANVRHKLSCPAPVRLVMIEGSSSTLEACWQENHISLSQGIFVEQRPYNRVKWISQLINRHEELLPNSIMDHRIQNCLDYFSKQDIQYPEMMQSLQARTHLSESRLSHLFKKEMGISLKKYLVWSRLRETIQYVIADQLSLYEAGLRSGFYDQAHLSKAFKQMLGLSPSKVYNSRTLQE